MLAIGGGQAEYPVVVVEGVALYCTQELEAPMHQQHS